MNMFTKIVVLSLVFFFLSLNSLAAEISEQLLKENQDLRDRLTVLEKDKIKNKIVIDQDIEFLYRSIINSNYVFKTDSSLCKNSKLAIEYKTKWLALKDISKINCINETTHSLMNTLKYEDKNIHKLDAIEEKLGITSNNNEVVVRIKNVYETINYSNWDQDRIRFMVLANYIEKEKQVVPSIGIIVFPSYKKYIPGHFALLHRTSLFLAYGQKDEVKNLYSTGLNFEIQDGFGINVAYSIYEKNNENKNSLSFGFVLSSDLWKKLFNFN